MPSTLPTGDPAPADGRLPTSALAELPSGPFGVYVHVPFCTVRCGYCDFNTYTADELGTAPGASRSSYADAVRRELDLAADVLGAPPPVRSIFFGGGTPALLPAADLTAVVAAIADRWGLAPDVEVTTEANPDSVDAASLEAMRAGGINRISFGMQSAEPAVLATLDRTHDPERVPKVVGAARAAGFDQVSLDLIYGTPGETLDQWRHSLAAVLAMEPDHVSAYALVVEAGTALELRVRRGELPAPDDDDLADKYAMADELLESAGYAWYEISNWARRPDAQCQHNRLYWTAGHWWGFGPGAHSHVGGVRWWNVKHPAAYAARLADGHSPAHAREVLGADTRRLERVLLESRLVDGLDVELLEQSGRDVLPDLVADGLVEPLRDRLVLTRRGRLLADTVVRALVP